MSKEKLDSFALDLKNIKAKDLEAADQNLKDALAENSIRDVFSRLSFIYQDAKDHDWDYKKKQLQELIPVLNKFFTSLGKEELIALANTDNIIGTASSNDGAYNHLAFILQSIKQNR